MRPLNHTVKLFVILFLTFLSVMLIPTASTVYIGVKGSRELQSEIQKGSQQSFENGISSFDAILENILSISSKCAVDKNVRAFCRSNQKNTFTEYTISSVLSSHILGNDFIRAAYYYIPQYDLVLTSQYSTTVDDYFSRFYKNNSSAVIRKIENASGVSFVRFTPDVLALVQKLNMGASSQPVAIVLEISKKAVNAFLDRTVWIEGGHLILMEDNRPMFYSSDAAGARKMYNLAVSQHFAPRLQGDSGDIFCMTARLHAAPLTVMYTVPAEKLENQHFNMHYVVTMLTIILLISLALCIFLTHNNFKSLKQLFQMIPKSALQLKNNWNVLGDIESAIRNIVHQSDYVQRNLAEKTILLQEAFLEKLTLGQVQYFKNIEERMTMNNISLTPGRFCLIIFAQDKAGADAADKIDTEKLLIETVMTDFFTGCLQGYVYHADDNVAVLTDSADLDVVQQFCDRCIKTVQTEMNETLRFIVSRPIDAFIHIPVQYAQMMQAVRSSDQPLPMDSHGSVEKCTDIIKQQYRDPDFTVNSLADQMDMNPSYLSRIFKQQVGMGLLDYIHNYRLMRAKELLLDPEKLISDIAVEAGFANAAMMIRVFKKYEGITPGQYRQTVTHTNH